MSRAKKELFPDRFCLRIPSQLRAPLYRATKQLARQKCIDYGRAKSWCLLHLVRVGLKETYLRD